MSLLERESLTICAPVTAPGLAGVSVIRVSGKKALEICREMAPFLPQNPTKNTIYYGHLITKEGTELDEVLCSYFAHGHSFTGEETVEISTHGNPVIVERVIQDLIRSGASAAEPGEFTFRAFLNGRVDLLQAESVLSLIHAQSERGARAALQQLKGQLSKEISLVEDHLTWCLANIEAGIDFSTEDIDVLAVQEIEERVASINKTVSQLIDNYHKHRPVTEGLSVGLVGRPNAGKSSLLNALVKDERAIVTDIPGTTRDVLEASIRFEGQLLRFYDTAGIRETTETIEKIGVESSKKIGRTVDVVLHLFDGLSGWNSEDDKIDRVLDRSDIVRVQTKADLIDKKSEMANFHVSAVSQDGIEELLAYLKGFAQSGVAESGPAVLQARQYEGLVLAKEKATAALNLLRNGESLEFVALELQEGLLAILKLLGKRFDDQVMDRVFKEFCIGK